MAHYSMSMRFQVLVFGIQQCMIDVLSEFMRGRADEGIL